VNLTTIGALEENAKVWWEDLEHIAQETWSILHRR
jgi:hypothetical protein